MKWPVIVGMGAVAAGLYAVADSMTSVFAYHLQTPTGALEFTGPKVHSAFMKAVLAADDPQFTIVPEEQITVLGEHTLTFGQEENQVTNVALCVQSLNGITIPPGAVFSFNNVVGERSEGRGFRPGLMYIAGEVVTGVGGGVCIPATAVYVAALQADMEIVERYHHSGPVSYAEPGLDAAVVYGLKDLRFRNTSDAPVTLKTMLLGNRLSVQIDGRPTPGRHVEISRSDMQILASQTVYTPDPEVPQGAPVVEQEGRTGYIVTVYRTVTTNRRVVRRDALGRDVVAARDRVVRYNPADDPAAIEEMLANPEAAAPVDDVPVMEATSPEETAATPEIVPETTPDLTPRNEESGTGSGPKVLEPPKEDPSPSEPEPTAVPAPSQVQPAEVNPLPPAPPPPAFVPDA